MTWASKQSERIAVYVDGANAYFAQKESLGWWIDWDAFLSAITDDKELVSARWYQAYRATPESEQDRFLHHLSLVGFAVRKKVIGSTYDRVTGQSSMKGNLDVDLTVDALSEHSHFDTAILVTGDSAFVPLIEALKAHGKRVIVVATQGHVDDEMRQAVGVNYVDFRDLREQVGSTKDVEKVTVEAEPVATDAPAPKPTRAPTAREAPEPPKRAAAVAEGASSSSSSEDEFDAETAPEAEDIDLPVEGDSIRCRVQAVKKYGVFLDLHQHAKTLLHVKDMNRGFVPDAGELYQVGEEILVKVISIDRNVNPPEVRVAVVGPEVEY